MHYIRILRPPSLVTGKTHGGTQLELLLAITTDLGESFLCPDEPVELEVVLLHMQGAAGGEGACTRLPVAKGEKPLRWAAGSRILKAKVQLPAQADGRAGVVCVRPLDARLRASAASSVLAAPWGLVMPLYVGLGPAGPGAGPGAETVALRRLRMTPEGRAGAPPPPPPLWVEVEEELGESIARHVWDAGVYLSAVLADICCGGASPRRGPVSMPVLEGILGAGGGGLDVLEIGSGVGVLGIALATALLGGSDAADGSRRRQVSVLMTDLPEARDRALANISRYDAMVSCSGRGSASADGEDEGEDGDGAGGRQAPVVDYENLDWEDGRKGAFAAKILASPWDLIMLSDCTYNVDMLPALVETLSQIHAATREKHAGQGSGEASGGRRVLLATKPRHPSEKALFGLMSEAGWEMEEQAIFDLPVFDAKQENIEVYVFSTTRPSLS